MMALSPNFAHGRAFDNNNLIITTDDGYFFKKSEGLKMQNAIDIGYVNLSGVIYSYKIQGDGLKAIILLPKRAIMCSMRRFCRNTIFKYPFHGVCTSRVIARGAKCLNYFLKKEGHLLEFKHFITVEQDIKNINLKDFKPGELILFRSHLFLKGDEILFDINGIRVERTIIKKAYVFKINP